MATETDKDIVLPPLDGDVPVITSAYGPESAQDEIDQLVGKPLIESSDR